MASEDATVKDLSQSSPQFQIIYKELFHWLLLSWHRSPASLRPHHFEILVEGWSFRSNTPMRPSVRIETTKVQSQKGREKSSIIGSFLILLFKWVTECKASGSAKKLKPAFRRPFEQPSSRNPYRPRQRTLLSGLLTLDECEDKQTPRNLRLAGRVSGAEICWVLWLEGRNSGRWLFNEVLGSDHAFEVAAVHTRFHCRVFALHQKEFPKWQFLSGGPHNGCVSIFDF